MNMSIAEDLLIGGNEDYGFDGFGLEALEGRAGIDAWIDEVLDEMLDEVERGQRTRRRILSSLPRIRGSALNPARYLIPHINGQSLQDKVVQVLLKLTEDRKYYSELRGNARHVCYLMSLQIFAEACRKLATNTIRTVRLSRSLTEPDYPFPNVRRTNFQPWIFASLWSSSVGSRYWRRFDEQYRGAGAPGALRYAGLAKDNPYIQSTPLDIRRRQWPSNLKKGAFLQLWRNESTYQSVKNGNRGFGHSCVFKRYLSPATIEVADQMYPANRLKCGEYFSYLIGTNLHNVRVD
jgi:hypothetical protein